MPRYRRVNIDGQSLYKTETRTTAAALLPGTAATINSSDKFAQATALTGRLYIIDVGYHQGLTITESIPPVIRLSATTSKKAVSWRCAACLVRKERQPDQAGHCRSVYPGNR
jgi:hypothetical protein